jgi:oxygen-independent coproporphyrinogen-3 oxidase
VVRPDLALFVSWPALDQGKAIRRALVHALATAPGGTAARRLVSVLIDAAGAPPPDAVAGLLSDLGGRLAMAADLETTLAIDARTIGVGDLAPYRACINRLALRAAPLHKASEALLVAAGTLFPACAVDLTFGRPGQTLASWQAELRRARQAGASHISIEEHLQGDGPDSDHIASLYQGACEALGEAGMPPYEIGHFARPGQESRHLLHGATGGDYLGVGPGAAGRITDGGACHALSQIAPAAAWLRAVESGTESEREVLTKDVRRSELILTGLRLRAGIERGWFEALGGPLETALASDRLAALVDDGFLVLDRRGLRLSERGWPLCDAVLARLLA